MVTFRDDPRVVFCHAKRRESTLTAGSKGENLTRHPVCPPLRTGKTTHKVTAHEMMSLRTFPRGHTGQRGLRATNTRRDPTHSPGRSTPRRHTRHQTRHPHWHRPHPQARREHPPDRTHPRPPSRRHTHRSDLHSLGHPHPTSPSPRRPHRVTRAPRSHDHHPRDDPPTARPPQGIEHAGTRKPRPEEGRGFAYAHTIRTDSCALTARRPTAPTFNTRISSAITRSASRR